MRESVGVTVPGGSEVALEFSAVSVTGAVREVNEDSFVAAAPLFLVADGMGGHARGDQASRSAASVMAQALVGDELPTPAEVLAAIESANLGVYELSQNGGDWVLSGTTLAGVALVRVDDGAGCRWMVFNVGDSRVYTFDGRTLSQLTVDHSAVQELVDAGLITPEDALRHPERNVITRALGSAPEVEADVWLMPVNSVHTFLVCSDGLTKELDDERIGALLAAGGADDDVAESLVTAASEAGGRDNITAVVVTLTPDAASTSTGSTLQRGGTPVLEDTTPRA